MKVVEELTVKVEVEIPAGEYWLGDPCYTVPDDMWMPWLEAADYKNQGDVLVAQVPGTSFHVLGFGTKWGDGVYQGTDGENYGVDAGLIGLVPVGLFPETTSSLSTKIVFEGPRKAVWRDNGLLSFGDVDIETNPSYEDEI